MQLSVVKSLAMAASVLFASSSVALVMVGIWWYFRRGTINEVALIASSGTLSVVALVACSILAFEYKMSVDSYGGYSSDPTFGEQSDHSDHSSDSAM